MPFKHYIRRIEGKDTQTDPSLVLGVHRYLSSHGGWRYGIIVRGCPGTYGEPEAKWACWENSLAKAVSRHKEAVALDKLKALFNSGDPGWLTYTQQETEEVSYAI